MDRESLLDVCVRVVDAVEQSLAGFARLYAAGERAGQYALDLVADRAALEVLDQAGLGVLSEESGLTRPDSRFVAVLDPVDGSTNASRGIPWYASSICVVDTRAEEGAQPTVAVVANLATKERYHAVRGEGAWKDGKRLAPSRCRDLRAAIVVLSGMPKRNLGWAQFRAFGAAALDLCAVAEGIVDAFVVGQGANLAPWDYMGALLVCVEAGAVVCDMDGAGLVVWEQTARRAVAAGATDSLLGQLRAAARG